MPKKSKLLLDIAVAAFIAIAVLPQVTGIAVHEWLGLVALAALLAHAAARRGSLLSAARIALDAALFVALAVCVVSGVLVSATVLPMLGLVAPGYFAWDPLHAASAKVLLALVLVHATSHMGKFVSMVKNKE